MPFRFDDPGFLWLMLLAVPVVWLGRRSLASLESGRKWTAIALRLAVLLVLVLMLSGFEMVRWHRDLTVMAVVDQSESISRFAEAPDSPIKVQSQDAPPTLETWIDAWLSQSWQQKRSGDRLGLVTYDGRPTVRSMSTSVLDLEGGTIREAHEGTDTAASVRAGMAWFPSDTGKRMLLVTDGNDTVWQGAGSTESDSDWGSASSDLLTAAREAAAAGIPIDVLPIRYRLAKEVMVQAVTAPVDARKGRTIVVKAVLRATQPTPGVLHLLHDGQAVNLDDALGRPEGRIEAEDWRTQLRAADADTPAVGSAPDGASTRAAGGDYLLVKRVSVPLSDSGANRFEARFEPDKGFDSAPRNNRAEAFTLVHGKGKILVLDGVGDESGRILPEALDGRGLDTQIVPADGLPATLAQLLRYDAIVLQNVPAEALSTAQQKMIVKYVTDLGGGLVMIGGPDSFGAGAWTNTPVADILPVTCKLPEQRAMPSGALVIVLDRSGSMQMPVLGSRFNKQETANESAVLAIMTLLPEDHVGVVAFSSGSDWVHPLQPFDDPRQVADLVLSIQSGGGTNIYGALQRAYQGMAQLTDSRIAIKHIIMLTDGRGQGGNYETLLRQMKEKGITLSAIGVGDDVDGDLLKYLADAGGGIYYPVVDPNDLPQVFVKEARNVRKSLIREVPFVPQVLPTGSPIMAGITSVPRLRGLVLTGKRHDGRVFTPIIGPDGEPVFAHWQVGLGRVAAFTSDATNRWATPWLSWPGFTDFWARTMRAVARPSASRQVDLLAAIERDTLRIRLDASGDDSTAGPDGAGDGGSSSRTTLQRVEGTVFMPDGRSEVVRLEQVGPGVYEAAVPAAAQGNYIISLFIRDGEGRTRYVFGGANRPPGAELRFFASNSRTLEQVAALTGGRVLDPAVLDARALFARDKTTAPTRSIRPVWRLLLGWLLALFLLDVAVRRVAWDFVAIAAKLGAVFRTRQVRAEPTLDALKRRAAKFDRDPEAQPDPPNAQRRFEAAPAAAAAPADFTEAVNAVTVTEDDDEEPAPEDPVAPPAPAHPAATTGRLLDAKRRARQRLDNEQAP